MMRMVAAEMDAMKARCHGDYNLRQVWLSNNDFLITNYGGGLERAWRERRWKHSPLRDIAGMLFSFSEGGCSRARACDGRISGCRPRAAGADG